MQIKADTPEQYIDQLPEDRKTGVLKLAKINFRLSNLELILVKLPARFWLFGYWDQ